MNTLWPYILQKMAKIH